MCKQWASRYIRRSMMTCLILVAGSFGCFRITFSYTLRCLMTLISHISRLDKRNCKNGHMIGWHRKGIGLIICRLSCFIRAWNFVWDNTFFCHTLLILLRELQHQNLATLRSVKYWLSIESLYSMKVESLNLERSRSGSMNSNFIAFFHSKTSNHSKAQKKQK